MSFNSFNFNSQEIKKQILSQIQDKLDIVAYAKNRMDVTLYPSQIKMARAIIDSNISRVAMLCSRQFGKTETISVCALYLADTRPGIKILIFAPTWRQAKVPLGRIRDYAVAADKQGLLFSGLELSNQEAIKFKNGSTIQVRHAGPDANIVGLTGDIVILDESQGITDSTLTKQIAPMIAGTGGKLIKIGTPNIRNHFYRSFQDEGTTKFIFDWTKCENYLRKGRPVEIQGVKYPREIIQNQMPRSLKLELFKEVMVNLTEEEREIIEYESPDADEHSFRTEYMLEWSLDTFTFLSAHENSLLSSGNFKPLEKAEYGEAYYMGLDFAASGKATADATAISVIRLNRDYTKDKVFSQELKGMNFVEQMMIIKHIYTLFKPLSICADYTGIGRGPVDVLITDEGLPIIPIQFGESDRRSPKWENEQRRPNYKTSMFDYFKLELNSKRFRYPMLVNIENHDMLLLMNKGLAEWEELLLKPSSNSLSLNKDIRAPQGKHDDHVCADILANYASLIGNKFFQRTESVRKRPKGAIFKRSIDSSW